MAYVTSDDIQERLGGDVLVQLADDDGDGAADAGVIEEVLRGAEGEVNAYLARRYQLPIDLGVHADLVDVLRTVTLDLAEYRLRSRRPPVAEVAIRMREQAVDWLRRVADGEIELPSATPVPPRSTARPGAASFGDDRVLSREELSDY